jgi:DNA repair protein RadC
VTRKVTDMPRHLRPREKLVSLGPEGLSDTELLMILLGSGSSKRPVRRVARDLRGVMSRSVANLSLEQILAVKGVGPAKAATILSALELARRRSVTGAVRVRQPRDILPLVNHLKNHPQENFVAISLNGNHEVLNTRVVTIGLANFCQVHPREVFADLLLDRATSAIVAHNHPSGNLEPSDEDIAVTQRLQQSARILGIKLLDHVLFSGSGYVSLRERYAHAFAS